EEQMTQTLDIDMVLRFRDINATLLADLKKMNPFGPDNLKPVFCSLKVKDYGTSKLVGKDLDHIKLELIDDSSEQVVQAIAFGMGQHYEYIQKGGLFDICYTIEENNYNNSTTLQLLIKDIRPSTL
ncbi:single-stranded-DNA-specific exonuclease RecJ, partial [Bacteroidales bacterium OttesenSCG-928-J19]|nr:single-stranded-DNA-specific exonuclease RecJ [Bacteroidales bacterium OttesenSCG-928-J19]